jgi:hypothetical protein
MSYTDGDAQGRPSFAAPQPFGCIIPGLAPVTDFNEVADCKWTAALGYAAESVVVFLTGTIPVPEGQGLGIYISRADEGAFEFLGYLTNERPSSTFHVPSSFIEVHRGVEVVLGLSLQPLLELDNLGVNASIVEQQRAATHFHVAQRVADDLQTVRAVVRQARARVARRRGRRGHGDAARLVDRPVAEEAGNQDGFRQIVLVRRFMSYTVVEQTPLFECVAMV